MSPGYDPQVRLALEAEHAPCYDDPIYDGREPRHDWTWHDHRVAAPPSQSATAADEPASRPADAKGHPSAEPLLPDPLNRPNSSKGQEP